MNSLNILRLRKVVTALRDAAKIRKLARRFDMDQYGYAAESGNTCGTPSCALGHFAARRDLQSLLRLDINGDLWFTRKTKGELAPRAASFSSDRITKYFGFEDWEESELLFSSTGCGNATTPGMAALFIERFCNRKEKELELT